MLTWFLWSYLCLTLKLPLWKSFQFSKRHQSKLYWSWSSPLRMEQLQCKCKASKTPSPCRGLILRLFFLSSVETSCYDTPKDRQFCMWSQRIYCVRLIRTRHPMPHVGKLSGALDKNHWKEGLNWYTELHTNTRDWLEVTDLGTSYVITGSLATLIKWHDSETRAKHVDKTNWHTLWHNLIYFYYVY